MPKCMNQRTVSVWLAESGRNREDFNSVDRLCYVGNRGVGALEYEPAVRGNRQNEIEISERVALIDRVLNDRHSLTGSLTGEDDHDALLNVLNIGTSAGGARVEPENRSISLGSNRRSRGF